MNQIESISNPYIQSLTKLTNKKGIMREGKYLVEGRNIIIEAIESGLVIDLLVTDELMYQGFDIHRTLVSEKIIEKLSTNKSNRGTIAVLEVVEPNFPLGGFNKIIVLDQVNNPGNLGAIIRSAKALGFDAVFTIGNSVYKYNEKVIKATQGVMFNYPVIQLTDTVGLESYTPYYFMLSTSSKSIDDLTIGDKSAIVFGNEANGIRLSLLDI
jgi:TrmH family RNA methyltransferase